MKTRDLTLGTCETSTGVVVKVVLQSTEHWTIYLHRVRSMCQSLDTDSMTALEIEDFSKNPRLGRGDSAAERVEGIMGPRVLPCHRNMPFNPSRYPVASKPSVLRCP